MGSRTIPLDVDGDGDIDFVTQTGGAEYLEHTVLSRERDINIDKYIDTDRDGLNDQYDTDDDNDGINNSEDAFSKGTYQS